MNRKLLIANKPLAFCLTRGTDTEMRACQCGAAVVIVERLRPNCKFNERHPDPNKCIACYMVIADGKIAFSHQAQLMRVRSDIDEP